MARILTLLLGCLLVLGCQTTKPAAPGGQSGQAAQTAAQAEQSAGQTEQQQAVQGGAASGPARSASRGAGAVSAGKLVSAVSNQINSFFNSVKSLVKRRPAAAAPTPRPRGPSINLGDRLKSALHSVNLASPDLLPTLAAAAILLGGGSLVLAAILTRRRRS